VHRPPARRPRGLAGTLIAGALAGAAATSCADDGPVVASEVRAVAIASQPCDRPLPAEGMGVVLGDGIIATAGHLVEGARRTVTADGAPATILSVDARTDVAILRADVTGGAALADQPVGAVHVTTPDGDVAALIVRTGALVVHDTTDRAAHRRQAHTLRPDVAAGTSGAPLVDGAGAVVGIVVLANRRAGTSYASTAAEIRTVLAGRSTDVAATGAPAGTACPD